MFSWISIHREAIHRILEHRQDQKELLTILREMDQQGPKQGAGREALPKVRELTAAASVGPGSDRRYN
jgi:hypothetical protein